MHEFIRAGYKLFRAGPGTNFSGRVVHKSFWAGPDTNFFESARAGPGQVGQCTNFFGQGWAEHNFFFGLGTNFFSGQAGPGMNFFELGRETNFFRPGRAGIFSGRAEHEIFLAGNEFSHAGSGINFLGRAESRWAVHEFFRARLGPMRIFRTGHEFLFVLGRAGHKIFRVGSGHEFFWAGLTTNFFGQGQARIFSVQTGHEFFWGGPSTKYFGPGWARIFWGWAVHE